MFGEPNNPEKQRKVLEETLQGFEKITTPGGKLEMPYRWETSPVKFRGREITEGP
jgi:hypothetical protein